MIQSYLVGVIACMAVICLSACGSSGRTQSKPPDKISEDEVRSWASTFTNAYEIVEQARPFWLRKRGQLSLQEGSGVVDHIVVYEDFDRLGDPEQLRLIPAMNVLEIEYYSPGRAIPLGPPDHPHGAIIVRTKR